MCTLAVTVSSNYRYEEKMAAEYGSVKVALIRTVVFTFAEKSSQRSPRDSNTVVCVDLLLIYEVS
jgi:hypothetical protein